MYCSSLAFPDEHLIGSDGLLSLELKLCEHFFYREPDTFIARMVGNCPATRRRPEVLACIRGIQHCSNVRPSYNL